MGRDSWISWTDHTFNPWWGCTKISAGCANCYAAALDSRWSGGKHWERDGLRQFFGDKHWNEPLKWAKRAASEGRRAKVFCASMADVFENHPEPRIAESRERLWGVIEKTGEWLDWLLLTKRPENIAMMAPERWSGKWPDHVWIGATAENQDVVRARLDSIARIPERIRFVSYEPAIGPLDIEGYLADGHVQWVICGGESGTRARPMPMEWADSIRCQCAKYRVPFFMKQLGGRFDKRGDVEDIPANLRIREFPNGGTA